MRVMAQMGMVMNLDKCIGCHTCSVTCKQAWTNRAGTEYVWFNNVETRPGQGYPRRYEDQEKWHGGWVLNKRGKLVLKAGGRVKKLFGIFASPVQPELKDYYEPWTYDYKTLVDAPLGDDFPVARPKSLITGEDTKITWSANWDDDLGGSTENGHLDPIVEMDRLESTPPMESQADYVREFDLGKRHALHLSYWTDGDTRRRGEVLGNFKKTYRQSDILVDTHGELPDYLPMVLEYAGLVDLAAGRGLLIQYRPSLEMLRFGLLRDGLPHARILQAVCATLPGKSPADEQAVMRMAGYGPPTEAVGLDPYDPRLLPVKGA